MEIVRKAQAGTMQSSDLMVFLEPAPQLRLEIDSTVKKQFEHLIRKQAESVLQRFSITSGVIRISDRGALDYAIAARLETGLLRACADQRTSS
ncbi:citrate lyase acyl carrier protein [Pelovirga terrestris]|uniref:Citrate lyase acyl carrier protein n=1 Tax=Pelovirga terrestris TaxID=2771352 RepID=A0A8J6QZ44_9BACT|nr:citrate lyase acyl carrier protein [Pelovirga terrestris]MBD1401037.1 citrate lyase acyl carrier protein [Pelovirga terrestris]